MPFRRCFKAPRDNRIQEAARSDPAPQIFPRWASAGKNAGPRRVRDGSQDLQVGGVGRPGRNDLACHASQLCSQSGALNGADGYHPAIASRPVSRLAPFRPALRHLASFVASTGVTTGLPHPSEVRVFHPLVERCGTSVSHRFSARGKWWWIRARPLANCSLIDQVDHVAAEQPNLLRL